jgi:hypothetical protein
MEIDYEAKSECFEDFGTSPGKRQNRQSDDEPNQNQTMIHLL